jgi:hypothetical protein
MTPTGPGKRKPHPARALQHLDGVEARAHRQVIVEIDGVGGLSEFSTEGCPPRILARSLVIELIALVLGCAPSGTCGRHAES